MTTPMMQQWQDCKEKAKDALLLFRLGDFYEAFYQDAYVISKELDLTLTKRQNIPMCGVPFHTGEVYVDRLIDKGFKVAIAEQTEDPKKTKGLVKREVTRVLSPATIINSNLIKEKSNNFFVSINQIGLTYGLAILDITTSEFNVLEIEDEKEIINEIYRLKPTELLISQKCQKTNTKLINDLTQNFTFVLNVKEDWFFDLEIATDKLINHFNINTLDSFGLKSLNAATAAAGALISYLKEEMSIDLTHIKMIKKENLSSYMTLDYSCLKNLEITESLNKNSSSTLLGLLDKTCTAMGGRLLKKWIKFPLIDIEKINLRHLAIEEILKNPQSLMDFHMKLDKIRDLERIIMKIINGYALPRDISNLKASLSYIPKIKEDLKNFNTPLLKENTKNLKDITSLLELLKKAIVDHPPLRISDGGIFQDGYNQELDELRKINTDAVSWITNYQNSLREKTNLKTLKIGFTKVFGYYIEISKGQALKAPENFLRKQTLVNAERFITQELKEFETKIFSAEEKIKALETKLYQELKEKLIHYAEDIKTIADAISVIDAIFSLAKAANAYKFSKPILDSSNVLEILEGRHPIIEHSSQTGEFIPNDTYLDNENNQLFLITGPNMAGKSTYIRQVAVIAIMAQIGSYVPAKKARLGLIDKVFCRIGASDDLSRGQSTFMVEMTETANILNNCTSKSLIILDEIGRGTSTYDGISIAWAVAEFLLTQENKKAKTLFATHYWELTELEDKFKGAVNYNVAVKETEDSIVFLRKIIKGGTDKSYGIHVAKLAGLPFNVIKKAQLMLSALEKKQTKKSRKLPSTQYLLFDTNENSQMQKNVIEDIKSIKVDNITPVDALQALYKLKEKIKNNGI